MSDARPVGLVARDGRESVLAEGPGELILQRLDEVFERRALVGLDEDLRLHAGDELEVAELLQFLRRDGDADRVVADPGLLVLRARRRRCG